MLLSILIPSTHDRQIMLEDLLIDIYKQIYLLDADETVEVITDIDNGEKPTGTKRNDLISKAKGLYVCFVDSDDEISKNYLMEFLHAIRSIPDVIGFEGYMTTNGGIKKHFKISKDLPYITDIKNGVETYLRFNNHLCPVKKEIALQIGYPPLYYQEDYDYALRLKQSGLIKTEVYIPKELYHYKYLTSK